MSQMMMSAAGEEPLNSGKGARFGSGLAREQWALIPLAFGELTELFHKAEFFSTRYASKLERSHRPLRWPGSEGTVGRPLFSHLHGVLRSWEFIMVGKQLGHQRALALYGVA
jgi:hypothetical protein